MNNYKIDQIMKDLEDGFYDFIKQGKYKDLLSVMSNLREYSLKNQMYLFYQNAGVSCVKGIKKWNSLNRNIKKGEKALKVIAPITKKEDDEKKIIGYKMVSVFDISQTEGDEIELFKTNNNQHFAYYELKEALNKSLNEKEYCLKLNEELEKGLYGFCNFRTKEVIIARMDEVNEIATIIHECVHAFFHDNNNTGTLFNKDIKEIEAEGTTYVVLKNYGINLDNFNFSYLLLYSKNDYKMLQKCLSNINLYANTIIEKIDRIRDNI